MADAFQESLRNGEFQVIGLLWPPRSANMASVLSLPDGWRGKVDAVLVADNPQATFGISALAVAGALKATGLPTVLSVSCRDRNRIALASEVIGAAALGIENLFCVSGDSTGFGDTPEAKPVYDLDSAQLVSWLKKGRLYEEPDSGGAFDFPDFCVGGAVNVNADPLAPQLLKVRKKIAAGADFFITLPLFDTTLPDGFRQGFSAGAAKLIAGVLLPSFDQVKARVSGIPGPHSCIPEGLARKWGAEAEEAFRSATLEFTRNLLEKMRRTTGLAGVCVLAPGREADAPGLF